MADNPLGMTDKQFRHFYTPHYITDGQTQPTIAGVKMACYGWCCDLQGNLIAVDAIGSNTSISGLVGKVQIGESIDFKKGQYDRESGWTRYQKYTRLPKGFVVSEETDDVGVVILADALLSYVPVLGGRDNAAVNSFYIPDTGEEENVAHRVLQRISSNANDRSESLVRFGVQRQWAVPVFQEALRRKLIWKLESRLGYQSRTILGFQIYEGKNKREEWEDMLKRMLAEKTIEIIDHRMVLGGEDEQSPE